MASAILSVNGGFLSAAECSPKNYIELDTSKKEYRNIWMQYGTSFTYITA